MRTKKSGERATPSASGERAATSAGESATTPECKLTDHQLDIAEKVFNAAAGSGPRLKAGEENGRPTTWPDHPDRIVGQALLMDALGTTDQYFYNGIISQLIDAGSQGQKIDEQMLNFMMSVVKGIKPRDQTEAMLAAQMAAIHNATMRMARQLAHAKTIPHQDSAERALNKLARTYATQLEALKRYRTGGEQKVTVHHVSVQEGGQAIVGHVTHAPRESLTERSPVSPPALPEPNAVRMPLLGKPARMPVGAKRKTKK